MNINELITFINDSPTAWHAVQEMKNRLTQHGFSLLNEGDRWEMQPGKSYFVIRGGSLIAFSLPNKQPEKATILGTHTDSPALKIKPNPLFFEGDLPFLRVETYGGPILSTWMNRDLAIAGRVVIADAKDQVKEKLVYLKNAPVLIPTLAIHLDRKVNEDPKPIDKQTHLCPLLGMQKKSGDPKDYFAKLLQCEPNLLGFDLYLVPLENPRILGADGEMLASYRLDNLVSAHAALLGILSERKTEAPIIQMAAFWNHEEIGSLTDEGASSPFFSDVLKRITLTYKMGEEDFIRLKSFSRFISIDVAHGYHPSYKDKYDVDNAPKLGRGIGIKYDANQRYATNAITSAEMIQLCIKHKIPYQTFASHSNISSGTTIGPLASSQAGIPTVDIGIPELSMHASRELIAIQDYFSLCKLLQTILEL